MTRCPRCAEEILGEAAVCEGCGASLAAPAPRAAVRRAGKGRLARLGLYALTLAVVAAVSSPAWLGRRASGCEPQSWVDWHVAMRRQCLSPGYVCENMTTAKMLQDPEVAESYRRALEAGEPHAIVGLSEMVARMRQSYGCVPEAGSLHSFHAAPGPLPDTPDLGTGSRSETL